MDFKTGITAAIVLFVCLVILVRDRVKKVRRDEVRKRLKERNFNRAKDCVEIK